jgi:hypothetical protein
VPPVVYGRDDSVTPLPVLTNLGIWVDISKRPTLTVEDYFLFFDRAEASMEYFAEFYEWRRPKHVHVSEKFFQRIDFMIWQKNGFLKKIKGDRLSNQQFLFMKDTAKKFITRIKKCFGQDIVAAINAQTPLRDAETILAYSTKLTYRRAAGIIASSHISTLLIQLSGFRAQEECKDDDITKLHANLKNGTTNRKLKKKFLSQVIADLKMPTRLGIDAPT